MRLFDKNAKILVAGHRGMVGSALVRRLQAGGYTNVLTRNRSQLDLLDQRAVFEFLQLHRPDYIFIAAAKVGGIHANNSFRADFIYQNLAIEANLIHGAHLAGIERLCFLGSSCIYPRDCPQPIKEEYLLSGPLEPTNEPYAIAKIAGIKLCENYNRQYGRRYVSAMPTNLYGPNDNYDLANSHVLPALLRKAHLTKLALADDLDGIRSNEKHHGRIPDELLDRLGCRRTSDGIVRTENAAVEARLQVWGSGAPRREFLHVDDLADACVFLMEKDIGSGLYNVGTGEDVTIGELAEKVLQAAGLKAIRPDFDSAKPDGTPRKLLDVTRLADLGWRASIELDEGLARTYHQLVESACA